MNKIDKNVIEVIKDAVVTVPGVVSFANWQTEGKQELATHDLDKAIEYTNTNNMTRFRIHLVIISGVNIKDVMNEVQIRVKYELEKMSKFTEKFIVDIAVDDFILI